VVACLVQSVATDAERGLLASLAHHRGLKLPVGELHADEPRVAAVLPPAGRDQRLDSGVRGVGLGEPAQVSLRDL
jgi:hypothetical protein